MVERARIVDVSEWSEEEQDPDEPLGARGSTWLVEPVDDASGAGPLWIFKLVRQRTVVHEDQDPWFQEDWAEYVATRVGELVTFRSPTFGNELLFRDDH